MKLFLSTPAMLFVTALLGLSETAVSSNNSATCGRNAVEANRVWAEAFARCNTSTLSEAIADDCIVTTEYGEVVSKSNLTYQLTHQIHYGHGSRRIC